MVQYPPATSLAPCKSWRRLIDNRVGLRARGRADCVDSRQFRVLRCSGVGVFRPGGLQRYRFVRHCWHQVTGDSPNAQTCRNSDSVAHHPAWAKDHSNSHADEKTYADASAHQHADSGALHLARTKDHSNFYADEKSDAYASAHRYADTDLYSHAHTDQNSHFYRYANADIYTHRYSDSHTYTHVHSNSDKATYSYPHTHEYSST